MKRWNFIVTPHWLAGIGLCAAGVLLTRVVAPLCESGALVRVESVGRLSSLAGLMTIIWGVSRRVKKESQDPSDPAQL